MHSGKAKAAPWACYQGQGSLVRTQPCQGQGTSSWARSRGMHAAIAKVAPSTCSQVQGMQHTRLRRVAMGAQPRPGNAAMAKATSWARNQGKSMQLVPRQPPWACCQGSPNGHAAKAMGMHAPKAKVAPLGT